MAPSVAELEKRRIVGIEAERVTNVTSTDFPGHYPGEDHAWDLEQFKQNFHIQFHRNEPLDIEFDLIGIDASVANAFRRILIAEVPTLAIERVYIENNTSIVQDEVLAQRLGLVPLVGKREGFKNLRWYHKKEDEDDLEEESEPTDYNTVVLKLEIACDYNHTFLKTPAAKTETDPHKLYKNSSVYSGDIKFIPQGRQTEWFPDDDPIRAGNPNILLAKMRPGQCIDLEMHCVLGIGRDHAKFSPVATASYRLLPTIKIKQPILGADADKFAKCFLPGVVKVVKDKESGEKKAVVAEARKDSVSREALRHEEFKGKVELGRIKDHFIFTIESTGMFESHELFLESIRILRTKCENFRDKLIET